MALREVTGTPPIRGASRTADVIYPSPNLQVVTNGNGLSHLDRQGSAIQDRGTNTGLGVPPAGTGYTIYRGRIAFKQTGDGSPSGGWFSSSDVIYFPQNKLATLFQNDRACWRVAAILAMDSTGLGSGDTGLEVGTNVPFNIKASAANPGFRVGPTAPNAISVQVRQNGGGGFTIDQVVANLGAGTVDDWHMYEMRFIGATASRDAIFRVLIDGVLKASFSWGAGTLLPAFGNGATIGYTYSTGNRGANATFMAHGGISLSCAATEAGLL